MQRQVTVAETKTFTIELSTNCQLDCSLVFDFAHPDPTMHVGAGCMPITAPRSEGNLLAIPVQ